MLVGRAWRTPQSAQWPLRAPGSSELRTVTPLPALCLNVFCNQLPATAVEIARIASRCASTQSLRPCLSVLTRRYETNFPVAMRFAIYV